MLFAVVLDLINDDIGCIVSISREKKILRSTL